ncbi:MAG: flagellin, partial [Sulfitobacter sp.]|nr:flagellin [Sulfitobacter sp.]
GSFGKPCQKNGKPSEARCQTTSGSSLTTNFGFWGENSIFGKSGQALLIAGDDVIALRADVGFVEARIEKIGARNSAEATSLEYAKRALLEIDPYEAATKLEEAQFQLQSLYSVTVRMSQLSLVNFI